jgi:ATP-dependent RNA helicase DeaD
MSVAAAARPTALRRLLDAIDPPSAAIVARTPESTRQATAVLRALGHAPDDTTARVTDGAVEEHTTLVVLYDLPASAAEMSRIADASPVQVVALVQPRQLAQLRALAAGGRVTPFILPDIARQARGRDEKMRDELRAVLQSGVPNRELIALEPLLEEFDGVELAAAALRLLDRVREKAATPAGASGSNVTPRGTGATPGAGRARESAAASGFKRIFMTVGEVDGVRPSDLVGAIANEAGISSDQIGKVELRENHALVEIAIAEAERVAAKMTGVIIRGRKVAARLDQDRSERGPAGARGGDRGDRGDRGARGGPPRGGPRRDGPGGPPRGDRGDRGPRSGPPRSGPPRGDRFDRPRRDAAPRDEFADRGERMRRARPPRPDGE